MTVVVLSALRGELTAQVLPYVVIFQLTIQRTWALSCVIVQAAMGKVSGGYHINVMPLYASYTWGRVIQLREQDGFTMNS